jgi:hypothetical protein
VNVSTTDPTGKGASASIVLVVPSAGSGATPAPLSGIDGAIVAGLGLGLIVVVGVLVAVGLRARRRAREADEERDAREPKDAEWRDAP